MIKLKVLKQIDGHKQSNSLTKVIAVPAISR